MPASQRVAKLQGSHGELWVCADAEEVAAKTADLFVNEAAKAIADRGRFRVVLSGGSTPRRAYELLASAKWRAQVVWNKVDVFWGDERYVPADHPESNYRMANDALLQNIPIPQANVCRVPVEISPPEATAKAYEDAIRDCFVDAGGVPRFDLIFLGLGTNGHTASLFPHSPLLNERSRLVMADEVVEKNMWRITMTAPLLNRGRTVVFLVVGRDKAEVLRQVLCDSYNPQTLPAQLIRPEEGSLLWIVDEAAASLLRA